MKQEFICSGCGSKVLKYLCQLTRIDVVFCSLTCRNKNYKRVVINWSHPTKKSYKHKCLNCDVEFELNGGNNRPEAKYCSGSCRAQHYARPAASDETKVKLSIAAANQSKAYKGKHVYDGPKGFIYMKSSWEVKYANWLDSQQVNWKYEPEFKLSNGYVYLPDFQLITGVIIEIKGYMRPDAEVKWRMFEEEYPQIIKRLLRKEDLKELGVLT